MVVYVLSRESLIMIDKNTGHTLIILILITALFIISLFFTVIWSINDGLKNIRWELRQENQELEAEVINLERLLQEEIPKNF